MKNQNNYDDEQIVCPDCGAIDSMGKLIVANHLEFDLPYKEYRTDYICSICGCTMGNGGGLN